MGTDTRLKSIAETLKEMNISEYCFYCFTLQCQNWRFGESARKPVHNVLLIKEHWSPFCTLLMVTATQNEIG
jgi:hypothetical protein